MLNIVIRISRLFWLVSDRLKLIIFGIIRVSIGVFLWLVSERLCGR